ncbi:hypothetical protein BDC45DRAFT_564796 [Circinella umbellata]|nr:hypothetical protein BDC45DRAFT_564796 [Circinella umbellata]
MLLPLPATTTKRSFPSLTRLDYLVAYIGASLFATFLISLLFTRTEYKFPFPHVVNCIQLCIAWLVSTKTPIASLLPSSSPSHPITSSASTKTITTTKLLAPVTAAYVGWLVVNPLFLTHVSINAYHTFTGLALPFSLVLLYILKSSSESFLRKPPSSLISDIPIDTMITCGIYYFGCWISSEGFHKTSWKGIFFGILNALFFALYGVLTKRALTTIDPWTLVRHNTGWGCLFMIPFGLYNWFTWPGPVPAFINELGFWFQMGLTGLIGLGLQMLTIVLIKLSSPIMQTSAAGVKVCLQAILAIVILGNPLSKLNLFGIAIALSATCYSLYIEETKTSLM